MVREFRLARRKRRGASVRRSQFSSGLGAPIINDQTRQPLTCRTILQLSLSRSPLRAEFKRLVLMNVAQQNPVRVRTSTLEVPGKLPVCHQLSALLTVQPFA
jgi:hypothetical protein